MEGTTMTVDAGDTGNTEDAGAVAEAEKTLTQTQVNKLMAAQKNELESLRSKATQFDSLTESTKSEVTRSNEAAAKAEAKAEALQTEMAWRDTLLTRQEVAAAKGLDAKLWPRIKGETKEEIEADVADLLTLSGPRKIGGFKSGAASGEANLNDKERAAQALRGMRGR
jgi:hypothetical protein